jgi:hypothetical protein
VQVLCSEGIANHTGPESCVVHREVYGEALTGETVGQPLSRESFKSVLPYFRCKLTTPKTRKQLKCLGMQRFFPRSREAASPGPWSAEVSGCRTVTLACRLLIKSAPQVRKNRFKCSATTTPPG